MGHQTNFYITHKDTRSLESRLRDLHSITVLHSASKTSAPRVLESLDFDEGENSWSSLSSLFLVRPQDITQVVTRHVPSQGHWIVDVLTSPVIEFDRGYFDQKILRRGRIYYTVGFYSDDGTWIDKPTDFVSWAKSICSVVRRTLKRRESNLIGEDAERWLRLGFRPFPMQSPPSAPR